MEERRTTSFLLIFLFIHLVLVLAVADTEQLQKDAYAKKYLLSDWNEWNEKAPAKARTRFTLRYCSEAGTALSHPFVDGFLFLLEEVCLHFLIA